MKAFNHTVRKVGPEVQERINALGIGQKMQDLPEELWHESFRYYVKEDPNRKGGPNLRIIRLDPDQPSLTVTGYIFNKFVHPFDNRFITPREAARLQGFPDNIEFKGTLGSVQRQIGDAVPLELGQAIMQSLLADAKTVWPERKSFLALSLFSGAGGMDIACEAARLDDGSHWDTFACVEIGKDRCDTLSSYFGNHLKVFNNDISTIEPDFVLQSCEVSKDNIILVQGGPPCQSFSQAGKQKGAHDPRGALIFEFLRFVGDIAPPFFVMENVPNLRGIDKGRLLSDILVEMDNLGYHVEHRLLSAANYGSAQKRRRLIFVGTRKDLPRLARLPAATHGESADLFGLLPFKTVGDAFDGLPQPVE